MDNIHKCSSNVLAPEYLPCSFIGKFLYQSYKMLSNDTFITFLCEQFKLEKI